MGERLRERVFSWHPAQNEGTQDCANVATMRLRIKSAMMKLLRTRKPSLNREGLEGFQLRSLLKKLLPAPNPYLARFAINGYGSAFGSLQSGRSLIREGESNLLKRTYRPNVLSSYRLKKKTAFTLSEDATRVALPNSQHRVAFTLSEVLITLGIIGVVAALTIPGVVTKYRKQETGLRLKHFYSAINQAVKLSENVNGECVNWEYPTSWSAPVDDWFDKYLAPYLNIIDSYQPKGAGSCLYADCHKIYVLENGTKFSASKDSQILFSVQVRGNNVESGVNTFGFIFHPTRFNSPLMPDTYLEMVPGYPSGFMPVNGDRDNLMASCKKFPRRCAGLIMRDNWEIKEDYPYKI